jgi:hypothetical protein
MHRISIRLRSTVYTSVTLLILFSIICSTAAQTAPLTVNLDVALPLLIGQIPTVRVTVKDVGNISVQLVFVGLRFEWNPSDFYFIGGNSEKGAVLAIGEEITYPIPVQVPVNTTEGIHKLNTFVTYRLFEQKEGNWTALLAASWPLDVVIANPQSQVRSQTATQAAPQQKYNLVTYGIIALAALVAVIGITLFIARSKWVEEKGKADPNSSALKSGGTITGLIG